MFKPELVDHCLGLNASAELRDDVVALVLFPAYMGDSFCHFSVSSDVS